MLYLGFRWPHRSAGVKRINGEQSGPLPIQRGCANGCFPAVSAPFGLIYWHTIRWSAWSYSLVAGEDLKGSRVVHNCRRPSLLLRDLFSSKQLNENVQSLFLDSVTSVLKVHVHFGLIVIFHTHTHTFSGTSVQHWTDLQTPLKYKIAIYSACITHPNDIRPCKIYTLFKYIFMNYEIMNYSPKY